jgi:hypothetical protein
VHRGASLNQDCFIKQRLKLEALEQELTMLQERKEEIKGMMG